MPASDARIASRPANSPSSTARKPEVHSASAENYPGRKPLDFSIPLGEADAAEVEEMARAFRVELGAVGQMGALLALRMAVMAVRMQRSCHQERAATAERVRRAQQEFAVPEGLTDEAAIARLRDQAGGVALFDSSREATLARRYEAAAERSFYQALKEIRRAQDAAAELAGAEARAEAERAKMAAMDRASLAALASISPKATPAPAPALGSFSPKTSPAPAPAPAPALGSFSPKVSPAPTARPGRMEPAQGVFDVPITIGRAG